MLNIYVVAILLMTAALYGFFSPKDAGIRSGEADIIAQQMIYYHSAAGKSCKSTCSGPIDPRDALTGSKQGRGNYANGTFVSYANDQYVVTYYKHPGVSSVQDFANEYETRVTAALRRNSQATAGVWIAPYNRTTGRLDSVPRRAWRDPATDQVLQPNMVSIVLANPSIPDGAPVIVNWK